MKSKQRRRERLKVFRCVAWIAREREETSKESSVWCVVGGLVTLVGGVIITR